MSQPRHRRPARNTGKSDNPQAQAVNFRNLKSKKNIDHKARNSLKTRDRVSLPEGVFVVEGVAAIREYLRYKPEVIQKIFVKERAIKSVRDDLAEFEVELVTVAESSDDSSPSTPAWAHVVHEMLDWTKFLTYIDRAKDRVHDLVLVLDHISDPRNLGAIVRSAAFFGVEYVIVPERRQVLLTQASVNTAQGGFALTELVLVVNVSRALEELKKKGYWVLGAAMRGEPVSSIRGRYEKQALVLGSEDKGISQHVLEGCDVLVSISGAEKSLDSLNVSVAAGILLQQLVQTS